MGTITVWGRTSSANVQKVRWTLAELNVPYEHIELGGPFGGLNTPQYRSLNPNGLVPTLQDDDLVVWESSAIVRYLAARYGTGTLWPEHPRERAAADQWADWANTTFQPAWARVFFLAVRTPREQQNPEAIANAVAQAEEQFAILDERLARTPYVAGDAFTFGDIIPGVALYRWSEMQLGTVSHPNIARWHQQLLQRDAFRETVCVSYADLVGRPKF